MCSHEQLGSLGGKGGGGGGRKEKGRVVPHQIFFPEWSVLSFLNKSQKSLWRLRARNEHAGQL